MNVHDETSSSEERLAQPIAHAAVAQHVATDVEDEIRGVLVGLRSDWEVSLRDGFFEVGLGACGQQRIAVLGTRLHLAQASVHRVKQAARNEDGHEAVLDLFGIAKRFDAEPQQVCEVQLVLHGHQPHAVQGNISARAPAPACLAQVSRQRGQQDLRALHQIRVVVLAHAVGGEDQRGARLAEAPREGLDGPGAEPGDRRALLRAEAPQALAEQGEHGSHGGALARGQPDFGASLQVGLDAGGQAQRVGVAPHRSRCPEQLLPGAVPQCETLLVAAFHDVGLTQETPGIRMDQEGQVGLLADVVSIVEGFLHDEVAGGEGQGSVASRLYRKPAVCMDGGLVVIGRDHDQCRATVASLGQEVGVRNAGDCRIEAPQHHVVGAEPIVGAAAHEGLAQGDRAADIEVAHMGGCVRDGHTDLSEEARRRGEGGAEVEMSAVLADRSRATALGQNVHQTARDLSQGLVPADSLESPRAAGTHALERIADTAVARRQVAVAGPLLAAPWIAVRNRLVGGRIGGGLLFAPDQAAAGVEVPGAGRDAVGAGVGAPHDPLPAPALSVEVAPVVVRG